MKLHFRSLSIFYSNEDNRETNQCMNERPKVAKEKRRRIEENKNDCLSAIDWNDSHWNDLSIEQ